MKAYSLRGLGTQVAWGIWPALAREKGKAGMGGSRARATERRPPSRCRASRAAPPNRACSRHPSLRSGHAPPECGVRLSRRSVRQARVRTVSWPFPKQASLSY